MPKQQEYFFKEFKTHPGKLINKLLNDSNITVDELSIKIDYSTDYINKLINGEKDINYDLASKLETVFEHNLTFWLELQKQYNLELVLYNEDTDITK